MTTIAFDGETLAVDRAAWKGDGVWGEFKKLFTVTLCPVAAARFRFAKSEVKPKIAWAATGSCHAFPLILDWLENGGDLPELKADDSCGIVVHDGRAYCLAGSMTIIPYESYPIADGAGHEMALGAMLAGADAVKAIEIVASRSSYAASKIDSFGGL